MFVSTSKVLVYNTSEVIKKMKNHEINTNENKDFLLNVDSVHIILLLYKWKNIRQ